MGRSIAHPAGCAKILFAGVALSLAGLLASSPATAGGEQTPSEKHSEVRPGRSLRWLVIDSVGKYGRAALHLDALEAEIVAGRWSRPRAGRNVTLPDGSVKTWKSAAAGEDGSLEHAALSDGYAYASVEADEEGIMLLEASGHSMVYVNGQPRVGDPYRTGKVRLPIMLEKGLNDLLFPCRRGRIRAELVPPTSEVMIDARDATLPDLVIGEREEHPAGVVVINATRNALDNLVIRASTSDAGRKTSRLPTIPPLSIRKVAFTLPAPTKLEGDAWPIKLELVKRGNVQTESLDHAEISLRVRKPHQSRKRTFISKIDGSVQYYAVNPARPSDDSTVAPALFLTFHGAGVEAIGQVDSYAAKSWGHVVAPTNRRHYGFDWEDWGRLDALEVLELAGQRLNTDPRRVYLTGHSMGGHGVWNFGATFPDRFAAIGPSAGWISFWSYTGAETYEDASPISEMLLRARASSDTLAMSHNYAQHGVYILHGEDDDNVPVEQARTMGDHLAKFHHDFVLHEQPGAGHWWDSSDEPGTDCVDWAPMFDFFARSAIPHPNELREIDFTTVNPGVSAWSHWVGVYAQLHPLRPSRVKLRFDPGKGRFVGTTENVRTLALDRKDITPGRSLSVELDGQTLAGVAWPADAEPLWIHREHDRWTVSGKPAPSLKGPHRYGPFKEAFRNRVIFVYGTRGRPKENAWSFAKARYDAETFWYRGNGSIDVIPDVAFDPGKTAASRSWFQSVGADRNVILYGNEDTNGAWRLLLGGSPVKVANGRMTIGDRELTGDDLACLFIQPRPGSDRALVGVVGGSGVVGMRLTDRLPYFVSGIGYPDCIVLGPDTLSKGILGVRVAGFFGPDWSVKAGEFAWQDAKPPEEVE